MAYASFAARYDLFIRTAINAITAAITIRVTISRIRKTGLSKNELPVLVKPIFKSGRIITTDTATVNTPLTNTWLVHIKYENRAHRLAPASSCLWIVFLNVLSSSFS